VRTRPFGSWTERAGWLLVAAIRLYIGRSARAG
jgi:hypothetical protein